MSTQEQRMTMAKKIDFEASPRQEGAISRFTSSRPATAVDATKWWVSTSASTTRWPNCDPVPRRGARRRCRPPTRAGLAVAEQDAARLLNDLRAARERYEREVVGRDARSQFWKRLGNRWENALKFSRNFRNYGRTGRTRSSSTGFSLLPAASSLASCAAAGLRSAVTALARPSTSMRYGMQEAIARRSSAEGLDVRARSHGP
jgi:hypothetical protein